MLVFDCRQSNGPPLAATVGRGHPSLYVIFDDIQHFVGGNAAEVEQITTTVPYQNYTTRHSEYVQWLNGLFHVASFWAVEHWRLQARRFAALAGVDAARKAGENGEAKVLELVLRLWEQRLVALDQAIELVCADYGLDVQAVRRFAEAECFEALAIDVARDDSYFEQTQAQLRGLLCLLEDNSLG